MHEKRRRNWFEIVARTLFLGLPLCAMVGVAAAMLSAKVWDNQRRAAMDELRGQVQFDREQTGCQRRVVTDPKGYDLVAERGQGTPDWRLRFSLLKGVEEIKYGPPRDPQLEQRLHSLFPEAIIWLRHHRPDLYAPPPAPIVGRQ